MGTVSKVFHVGGECHIREDLVSHTEELALSPERFEAIRRRGRGPEVSCVEEGGFEKS